MCIYKYTYMYIHIYVCIFYIYIYIYMCVYIHIYICTEHESQIANLRCDCVFYHTSAVIHQACKGTLVSFSSLFSGLFGKQCRIRLTLSSRFFLSAWKGSVCCNKRMRANEKTRVYIYNVIYLTNVIIGCLERRNQETFTFSTKIICQRRG